MKKNLHYLSVPLGALLWVLVAGPALAVPSFARQTGMACAACHTVFPELNSFGRAFKLNGYTLAEGKQVSAEKSPGASALQFSEIPPLSMMLQVAGTHVSSAEPSNQTTLPDELSFFFAGKISPRMGSFIQMTMEQGTGFELDNTDIRYANRTNQITYGVTLNNSPTVEDLWNSTPVWGFPFARGAEVASPVVADALAQNVAGLGAYADWGNGLYTELSGYSETAPFDAPSEAAPGPVRVHGVAPYLRVAWSRQLRDGDYLMVGAYGMHAALTEEGDDSGPEDKYDDVAIDSQYEHALGNDDSLSVHAAYTDEKQNLHLSSAGSPTLKNVKLDGTYHFGNHAAASLGYTRSTGNHGDFDDSAITGEFDYLPWQNTKFSVQYVAYRERGGMTSHASDDNELLLHAWLMW